MSGYLRFLYEEVLNCETNDEWNDVFKKHWSEFGEVHDYYSELKRRRCEKWPDIVDDDSWNLYSVLRVSDLMLLSFQEGEVDGSKYRGPNITLENYLEFFKTIGFDEKPVLTYHPFYCEIVDVIETKNSSEVEIDKIKWPALVLGNMLFARAGVVVRAPKTKKITKGVANCSVLYWTYWRKYRKTNDLSMGWGSNSQWRTHFRRDYDLSDRYAYNVDGGVETVDLRFPYKEEEDSMKRLQADDRIEFLKNRCLTSLVVDDTYLWPFNDYYEESKS